MNFRVVFFLVAMAPASVFALEKYSTLSSVCRSAINLQLGDWKSATVREVNMRRAKKYRFDPLVTSGDFDGNGLKDQAVLLKHDQKEKLAVCLSMPTAATKVLVMNDVYCNGHLVTFPPGSEHETFGSGFIETLVNDGIGVACEDEPGPTYIYEKGKFKRVVVED